MPTFQPSVTSAGRTSGLSIAVGTSGATTLLTSIPGNGGVLRLANTGSVPINYAFLTAGYASITDAHLPDGTVEYVTIPAINAASNNLGLSYIAASATTLQVSRGEGG